MKTSVFLHNGTVRFCMIFRSYLIGKICTSFCCFGQLGKILESVCQCSLKKHSYPTDPLFLAGVFYIGIPKFHVTQLVGLQN